MKQTVAWHPYPKEKPPKETFYLVTIRTDEPYEKDERDFVTTSFFYEKYNVFGRGRFITAWAELPEPYKEVDE